MQYLAFQYRVALHALLSLFTIGHLSCLAILSGTLIGFHLIGVLILCVCTFLIAMIIMSDFVRVWRVGSFLSSTWLELFWLICLLLFLGVASVFYFPFFAVPYLPAFASFLSALSWVLVVLAIKTGLTLAVFLIKTSWKMRTLRQGREGVKVSGFQTILGIPRSLEERRVLIRDGIGGLFFHKTIFRKLPYETTWIALFRGSMALISTTCVGCYALNLLVVLPITESISLPIRTTTGMPQWKAYESSLFHRGVPDSSIRPVLSDVAFIFGQMQYNLTYSPSNSRPFLPEDFIAQPAGAVSTASLIRMDGSVAPCASSLITWESSSREYVVLNCSQADSQLAAQHIQLVVDYSGVTAANYTSDITFFTFQASAFLSADYFFSTMIPSLSAFPMINNVHVRGMSYLGERQIIRPSWKDVIGVGANWISFSTYSHTQLVPDVAPIGGFRDHTSTVLLSPAIDFSNVITQMDYRQHSILAGLASVGGVFTVVDGIFAMLFGTTLFTLILGTKHISPFGSLGILVREKLRRAIQEQYPALQSELQGGGMATFLRDVSVDLRILADPLAGSASSYSEISPKQRESSLAGDELELDTLYDAPGTYDTDKTLTPDYADVLLEPAHARQRDSHRASNASVDGLYRG